jgi:hypothetical protein
MLRDVVVRWNVPAGSLPIAKPSRPPPGVSGKALASALMGTLRNCSGGAESSSAQPVRLYSQTPRACQLHRRIKPRKSGRKD